MAIQEQKWGDDANQAARALREISILSETGRIAGGAIANPLLYADLKRTEKLLEERNRVARSHQLLTLLYEKRRWHNDHYQNKS